MDNKAAKPAVWRLDPEVSFSDWKIVVRVNDEAQGTDTRLESSTYHVHKVMIALSPRGCNYFASACRTGSGFSENETETSIVDFPFLMATAFPDFLDYIYGKDITDGEKLVPLYHLAHYFDNTSLLHDTKSYLEQSIKDLSERYCFPFDKFYTCYLQSCTLKAEAIDSVLVEVSANLLLKYALPLAHYELMKDLDMWFKVVSKSVDIMLDRGPMSRSWAPKNIQKFFFHFCPMEPLAFARLKEACTLLIASEIISNSAGTCTNPSSMMQEVARYRSIIDMYQEDTTRKRSLPDDWYEK